MSCPRWICALIASLIVAACTEEDNPISDEVTYTEQRQVCGDRDPLRKLLFGDLHFHTRHSWDAFGYQLAVTPAEAYTFARGANAVRLPPVGAEREVRIDRPLDFAGVTDHAELFGELQICRTPSKLGYDSAACISYRALGEPAVVAWGKTLIFPDGNARQKEICGDDGRACSAAAAEVWGEIQSAAEAAYDRSAACAFTSFVGYEYTATPSLINQHRNIIFRNDRVPTLPVTYFEQPRPLGLWQELQRQCLSGGAGCDVMVIPHNSNWSNGNLFSTAPVIAASDPPAMAALRAQLEPVAEVMQHKGDMECITELGGAWRADPQCSFEKIRFPPFEDCGATPGVGGVQEMGCVSRLDYLRGVLLQGLVDEERLARNIYRLGFIGGTDSHNGTPGNTSERGWPGHVGDADGTPTQRLGPGNSTHRGLTNNPGGLAAVWAKERSRDAIFEALRSREVYSTSGSRIEVRLFGGWRYSDGLCAVGDRVEQGYRQGVPMGGVLQQRPSDGAPRFFVEARADRGTTARPGTPLQQVQIVKGWLDAELRPQERVFVVAGDPASGAVDTSTCQSSGGVDRLCAVWTDPEFDPALRAFYYARVLESPTCRWSTWECIALPEGSRPAGCVDPRVQKAIQERAITSPIWYTPRS
jgi:hypothetical protein